MKIEEERKKRRKKKACNTDHSRVVSHHSTTPAQRSLTSESGRDPVHSPWYDRRRMREEGVGITRVYWEKGWPVVVGVRFV